MAKFTMRPRTAIALFREMRRIEQAPSKLDRPRTTREFMFAAGVYTTLRWALGFQGDCAPSSCAIVTGKKWTREQTRKSRKAHR